MFLSKVAMFLITENELFRILTIDIEKLIKQIKNSDYIIDIY